MTNRIVNRIAIYDIEERMRGKVAIYEMPELDSCTIGRGNHDSAADFALNCRESPFYNQVSALQCAIDRWDNRKFDPYGTTMDMPFPKAWVRHLGGKVPTFISKDGKTWKRVPEKGVRLDDNDMLSFGSHDTPSEHRGYQLLVRIDEKK